MFSMKPEQATVAVAGTVRKGNAPECRPGTASGG
jgi:hypothetical protein